MSRRDFIVKLGIGSTACLLGSCRGKRKKIIKTIEDGVEVIKNPSAPVFGRILFDLENDLTVGREDNENYLFLRVRDIAVDSRQNIYVLDTGNHRIQKMNEKGRYEQTIGRKGQGPGEFENPISLFLDCNEDLYVVHGRKMDLFNKHGDYQKRIFLDINIVDFAITSNGEILARISPSLERKEAVVRMDPEGKIIKYIAEFPDIQPAARKGSQKGSSVIFTAFHDYSPHICFSPANGENFYYGFPMKYEINVSDKIGILKSKIQKKEEPKSISQEEKNKIMKELEDSISGTGRKWPEGVLEEACKFPPQRPFFGKILVDDKKRLYVQKVKSVLDKSKVIDFDIFDMEGNFIYEISIPAAPKIIRNGCLYEIQTSGETGEIRINRYKIKNWGQMGF